MVAANNGPIDSKRVREVAQISSLCRLLPRGQCRGFENRVGLKPRGHGAWARQRASSKRRRDFLVNVDQRVIRVADHRGTASL